MRSRLPFEETRQEIEPVGLAFLGMELHAKEIVAPDGSDQPAAVIGHGEHVFVVAQLEMVDSFSSCSTFGVPSTCAQ